MRGFERDFDGGFVAELEPEEATILSRLTSQVVGLLTGNIGQNNAPGNDPALTRLLPDAYPDDAEASAEFRRFTADGLTERKIANAATVMASLSDAVKAETPTKVRLDSATTQAWLRSLTDIRLVLGERLGIQNDDGLGPATVHDTVDAKADGAADETGDDRSQPTAMMRDVYDWLGLVQESLLHALDS